MISTLVSDIPDVEVQDLEQELRQALKSDEIRKSVSEASWRGFRLASDGFIAGLLTGEGLYLSEDSGRTKLVKVEDVPIVPSMNGSDLVGYDEDHTELTPRQAAEYLHSKRVDATKLRKRLDRLIY